LPRIGLGRFIVVGKNAGDARAAARRAYKRWYESFTFLSSLLGVSHRHSRPPEFEAIAEDGRAFAGDPQGVAGYVRAQLEEAGANYFVGQFAFGNLSLEETLRSIGLFADEVMPMLKHAVRLASV
jgi:alkanesulfonate monooxygenase SsuD/methylene tetrahydromethanopterin reductase-like flavin-dependent oxidoreductase (luciferase family)